MGENSHSARNLFQTGVFDFFSLLSLLRNISGSPETGRFLVLLAVRDPSIHGTRS